MANASRSSYVFFFYFPFLLRKVFIFRPLHITLIVVASLIANEAMASGFYLRCSAAHLSVGSAYLRAVFRRDWTVSGIQRGESTLWFVNPRSSRHIQKFMDRYLPDHWEYDGKAMLIQRDGRVHSVVIYADSEKYGPSLVLLTVNRQTLMQISGVIRELKLQVHRGLVGYVVEGRIEEIRRL